MAEDRTAGRRLKGTSRTLESVRHHYEVETAIAKRLRSAAPAERATAYLEAYEELFRLIPDHPQLMRKHEGEDAANAKRQWSFLRRFVDSDTTLLEVGAGDCSLSAIAASTARSVIAADVSPHIMDRNDLPANVSRIITDGTSFEVGTSSVDLVYSNQLMEHLHPDDARTQLEEIVRDLAPGGRYVCITPNRATGPHDVSKYFDDEATGLHLKEYTVRELLNLFHLAGFKRARTYVGTRGLFLLAPHGLLETAERRVLAMEPQRRADFREGSLALPLLQIRAVATA
jgi:SAM-dependent methyltransferase